MGPGPNPYLHTKYKAIVVGATGSVGRSVVEALLASSSCRVVTVLLRQRLDIEHDKLRQHIVGFRELRERAQDFVLGHQVGSVCCFMSHIHFNVSTCVFEYLMFILDCKVFSICIE